MLYHCPNFLLFSFSVFHYHVNSIRVVAARLFSSSFLIIFPFYSLVIRIFHVVLSDYEHSFKFYGALVHCSLLLFITYHQLLLFLSLYVSDYSFYICFVVVAVSSSNMSCNIILIILLALLLPVNSMAFLFRSKILSPSADVHIDIKNYVSGALQQHANEFHPTWRDITLVCLVILLLGLCCCGCCLGLFIYVYRKMRRQCLTLPRAKNVQSVTTLTPLPVRLP
jgi:hypothetical protein